MSDLLVLATHAIQYQAPLFQHLSQKSGVNLHVAFMRPPDNEQPMWDNDFSRHIQWDIPLVTGYKWSTVTGGPAKRLIAFARLHSMQGSPPIMLTSWGTPFQWLVWTWAVLSKKTVLLLSETNKGSYLSRKRPYWRHLWLKFLLQHTHGILCIGERNREFHEWMGVQASNLFSCPYAVDNERFSNTQKDYLPERRQRLSALHLDPGLPTLVFSGKLIPKKRPDLLLEAVAKSELGHSVNVLFVGDGPLKDELGARSGILGLKNVAFLGFLNQVEMPLAYALGECLCLFSDTPAETWGLVVNEALACGRPVIVSEACGCVPDLVEGRRTGWVVPSGDLKGTSEVILEAVSKKDVWPQIGERGRDIVSQHSFANMADGIVQALERAGRR